MGFYGSVPRTESTLFKRGGLQDGSPFPREGSMVQGGKGRERPKKSWWASEGERGRKLVNPKFLISDNRRFHGWHRVGSSTISVKQEEGGGRPSLKQE